MIEPKRTCLDMASRRPKEWLGLLRGFDGACRISHQVAELELKYPVEALDDRDARSQERRFIGDQAAVRDVASQRRDELLDREQGIDDVRISLFANERDGVDRFGPDHVKALAAGQQVGD